MAPYTGLPQVVHGRAQHGHLRIRELREISAVACWRREMSQSRRLESVGRIDRSKPIDFSFNGKTYQGFQRSEEHTSELQSLMRISYAVFCLKKKKQKEK